VNQDQRNPRVLGASRSLWMKKLESGGQLRRGGRSLRRRRSAEGSVSLSKRPGVHGRRRPRRDRRWLRVAPEHSASVTSCLLEPVRREHAIAALAHVGSDTRVAGKRAAAAAPRGCAATAGNELGEA
jgi:hypothetical protein